MREWTKSVVKKVTLELIYEIVDERTRGLYEEIEKIKESIRELEKQRHEDFKYLNQKIDIQTGQLRQEISQLRQEINQLRQEIKEDINNLNRRMDTVIQLLTDVIRKSG
ncbi:MAG: hypothetical protein GXO18_03105 [Aquificae bacterium]|nr:hypothetical protein [Aquificota bacterium]